MKQKNILEDIVSISNVLQNTSYSITEEAMKDKKYKCKYCGDKFKTEKARDKHTKVCQG